MTKKEKNKKSEADLALEYASNIIKRKSARGHLEQRFDEYKKGVVHKDIWQDTDFYFSVVFETGEQKNRFLEFLVRFLNQRMKGEDQIDIDQVPGEEIKILNGIKIGQALGMKMDRHATKDFPFPDLDLKELILDDENY